MKRGGNFRISSRLRPLIEVCANLRFGPFCDVGQTLTLRTTMAELRCLLYVSLCNTAATVELFKQKKLK